MNSEDKRLLRSFRRLRDEDRATLLAFAEFLETRAQRTVPEVMQPQPIPRPEKETVVGAIKRLSATFPMLNRAKLLNETSVLVTQHVMRGRDAVEVIQELEVLFQRHYEEHMRSGGGSS
jgi:hypothetical protein